MFPHCFCVPSPIGTATAMASRKRKACKAKAPVEVENQEGIQRERGKLRHNLIDRTISCCRKQALEENARLCGVIGLIDFARDRESMN